MLIESPKLYINNDEEDIEALKILIEAKVPFRDMGSCQELPTPFIEYGDWRFGKIMGIMKFIELWKTEKLPETMVLVHKD